MSKKFQILNFKFQIPRRSGDGFTLIELLLVVVIIGILSTLVVVNFIGIRGRARDAQRKTDLNQIRTALQLYNSDEGSFPDNSDYTGECGDVFDNQNSGVVYMKKIPCDPLEKTEYIYAQTPAQCSDVGILCTGYTLYACLENTSDPSIDEKQPGWAVDPDISCTKGKSYTVTNP